MAKVLRPRRSLWTIHQDSELGQSTMLMGLKTNCILKSVGDFLKYKASKIRIYEA